MVTCIKRLPRIMASEALASLWQGKAPSGTDLAGIIIGNDALNACRFCSKSPVRSNSCIQVMQIWNRSSRLNRFALLLDAAVIRCHVFKPYLRLLLNFAVQAKLCWSQRSASQLAWHHLLQCCCDTCTQQNKLQDCCKCDTADAHMSDASLVTCLTIQKEVVTPACL